MRALVLLVLLAPLAAAGDPYVVLADWFAGEAPAGAPAPVEGVNAYRVALDVPACQREILLDLLYDPQETTLLDTPQVFLATGNTWSASLWQDGSALGEPIRVRHSGYGAPVGTAPAAGAYELRFHLEAGASVAWSARVRGHTPYDDIACNGAP